MTHVRLLRLLIAGLCLLLAGSQAVLAIQVSGGSAVVNSLGETASMDIRLDSAPQGLSGYNISLALSNPGVGEIVAVSFPSWAAIHSNTTLPADSVALKAVDLSDTAGTSDILPATAALRGVAAGSTNLLITVNQMDDDNGDEMIPSMRPGLFTVSVNSAPQLSAIGAKSVDEGQLLQFTIAATDPNVGDTLTFAALNLPGGATFDPSPRTFSWTPTYTQAGAYSVNFTVTDGEFTDFEEIVITVNNVDRSPTLSPIGNKSVVAGEKLSFAISASDPDGDPVSYSFIASPPMDGAVLGATSGAFSWTPTLADMGTYEVTFTASAGGRMDSEMITLTVSDGTTPTTIPAAVRIQPGSLKLGGSREVKATIHLPDGYAVSAIDKDSVTCNGAAAIHGTVKRGSNSLVVTFNQADMADLESGRYVTFVVLGRVLSGGEWVAFEGSDTIRVNQPKNAGTFQKGRDILHNFWEDFEW
ncbi:MAG: putative Ig domain-containing protein [Methanomicrobiales archaeon]|nr:putative Ig domain-containing protein [Methanomicrobiales archaeon]